MVSKNNKKFNLLMILAVVMALVTIVLVMWMLRVEKGKSYNLGKRDGLKEAAAKAPKVQATAETRVETLIARQAIPAGTVVLREMVETRLVPTDVRPPQAVARFEEIEGRVATNFLPEGDILMPAKLRAPDDIYRAAFLVEPGKRFFSMPINSEAQGVAGMLRVGDRVDIVGSYDVRGNGVLVSKILIQNLKIIDVVGAEKPDSPTERPNKRLGEGDMITFEGTPEDVELFKALQMSNIDFKFVLRNINDEETVRTSGVSSKEVISRMKSRGKKKNY